MSDRTQARVALAFFEYRLLYREPVFGFAKLYEQLTPTVFRALRNWVTSLENVTWNAQAANGAQIQVTFNVIPGKATFTVGLASAALVVVNPSWSEADVVTKIALAATEGIAKTGEVQIASQQTTLSIHLTPEGRSVRDVTGILALPKEAENLKEGAKAFGFCAYKENSTWVVDASALFSESLFLRIQNSFGAGVSLDRIIGEVKAGEDRLLDLLNLRLD